MRFSPSLSVLLAAVALASATQITEIQGPSWQSPLVGKTVNNVTGIVTAKGTSGFYFQGDPSNDIRKSRGLFVFSTSSTVLSNINVGDKISLTGRVAEFRSSSDPDDLTDTELDSPTNIVVQSSGNVVKPTVIGVDRFPPTQALSALDVGADGWLTVPNNQSRVDSVNATLQPAKFGMDFWASLEGQLITVPSPVAIDFENNFGEFWIHGNWPVTGKNGRGGLTITIGPDGVPDANPETIIVGKPLDGTKNPKVSVGKTFQDITGVVQYQFGFYYILPLTAPIVVSTPDPTIPATKLKASTDACVVTIGDYNVENMTPTGASHINAVASQIANLLLSPNIMFVQEIQDNSGATDDGTVSANVTLTNLANAITTAGSNVKYSFTEVVPVNDQDGGQPGGNIRQAYLYDSSKVSLATGPPAGGPLDATKPVIGSDGKVTLTFNPGRIDPTSSAWNASRKPLVGLWETTSGKRFFTINLHLTAKLGSSSTQGNSRPPVNAGVGQRTSQIQTVATFVKSILALDPKASIIVAGDFNEYVQTRSAYTSFSRILTEADEAANIDPVERYTYVFDQNTEQLDHIFVSDAVAKRGVEVEHVHVNSWAASESARTSDHDPSVARLKVC
ncbi:DNase I-like protein [Panus rudis PR-1116 ss-1]|nr:DNase I-like protein [Panus rudis PR-1116 ss-1]